MLECLIDEIRDLLRKNGNWNIHIELWGLYGTYKVTLTYLDRDWFTTRGMHLEKHLELALETLKDGIDNCKMK